MRRSLCWGAVAALVFTGCSSSFIRQGAAPPSPSPRPSSSPYKYGLEFEDPKAAGAPVASGTDVTEGAGSPAARLVITLVDQNKLHPSDIPANLTGVIKGVYKSDKDGKLSFKAKAGQYTLQVIAGCSGPVIVDYGGGGSGHLVAGQTASGTIQVSWRHTIAPGEAAFPSQGPVWPVGETIDITYDVIDRCANDKASNATFPTWQFKTSSNLELVGTPLLQSDGRSQSLVKVRCRAPGTPTLIALDSKNPTDEIDVIKVIVGEGRFSCE